MPSTYSLASPPSDAPTAAGDLPRSIRIVSGSCVLREGLAALLIDRGETRADSCQICQPFPELPWQAPHDQIVLLDGATQAGPAINWITACRSMYPLTQVMVIELLDSVDAVLTYMRAGVRAYALRGASIVEIVTGIHALCQGEGYCSPQLTGRLFEHLNQADRAQPPAPPAGLSARELEVLHYLAADYSNQQIAEKLVIDVRTVKHHVHNILQKLGVRRRWDAARLLRSENWPQKP